MIRVCIFCEKWGSGGIESFLLNAIEHMDGGKINFTVVASKIESQLYIHRLKACNICIIELSGSLRKLSKNHRMFRHVLSCGKFDVIHLNIYHALSMYYAVEAKRLGIQRCIIHSHNNALRPSKTRMIKQAVHCLSKYAFVHTAMDFWACSGDAAAFMFPTRVLRKKTVSFVPNGIELQRFQKNLSVRNRIRNSMGFKGCFVIGNVGRLCPQKNQLFLLEIFSRLEKKNPHSRLLLIGEGSDEQKLRQKARELHILDKVVFYGVSKRVEELYWAMDIFVFPSTFEGLGIAAIEAQAAGLPTICSNYVPAEAIATPLACQVNLAEGADVWAEKILAFRCAEACEYQMELLRQGYEIREVAQKIEKVYSGEEQSRVLFRPVERK